MEEELITITEGMSNCCGAGIYSDTDICSDCKEHCSDVSRLMCKKCGDETLDQGQEESLCGACAGERPL